MVRFEYERTRVTVNEFGHNMGPRDRGEGGGTPGVQTDLPDLE